MLFIKEDKVDLKVLTIQMMEDLTRNSKKAFQQVSSINLKINKIMKIKIIKNV